MIITTILLYGKQTVFKHTTLTDALIFARRSEIGATFQIREGKKLLAKGKIEKYKDTFNEKKV